MKVKARTNIKYDGTWRFAGAVFEVREEELKEMAGMVEVLGETKAPAPKQAPEKPKAEIPEAAKEAEAPETRPEKKPAVKTNTRKRKAAE